MIMTMIMIMIIIMMIMIMITIYKHTLSAHTLVRLPNTGSAQIIRINKYDVKQSCNMLYLYL